MYFKGPIHRRYLGLIRKLKWMTAALSKLSPSLPLILGQVRGFIALDETPSQREYKCKSKCRDAIEGPLFIESIIICRRRAERQRITTGNWYTRGCLHVAIRSVRTGTGEQVRLHNVAPKDVREHNISKRFFFFVVVAENTDCRSL